MLVRLKGCENVKGIVRRVDDLGRITIPKEIRDCLGIKLNDKVDISVDEGKIVVKKFLQRSSTSKIIETAIDMILKSRSDDVESRKLDDECIELLTNAVLLLKDR